MKKYLLIIMALAMITAIFANGSRFEVVAWQEDFETGAPGWTHYDALGAASNWHVYANGDAQGNVWWMGDPALASGVNIGGYNNSQYLALDTPARTLDATNSTLTFKLRYKVEVIAGATAPYNGWDASNVRISVAGGAWVPITGTPAYNMTSSFAFGDEHGEGANIPGWGGAQLAWVNATFNLSAYVGQSVKIRFAFASDPSFCTTDDRSMFGLMVDDVAFGGYTNNGINDGQMVSTSLTPPVNPGPDLWHVGVVADAPSPTHAMICKNASGVYEPHMLNWLVSPSITLPNSGDIRADFQAHSDFTDTNAWPDVDYFGFEISPDDGINWFRMSNPYGTTTNNYVFTGQTGAWGPWTEGWGYDGLISDYAGHTVKFRWVFRSDDDTPVGTGFMIDNVTIYNDIFVAPPENLAGVVTGSSVALSWAAPGSGGGGGEPGWLTYSADTMSNSIGSGSAVDFDVAAKWDPVGATNSIYPYLGMNITKISFIPVVATASFAVRIWTGGVATMVVDQVVTNPVVGQWNDIVLNTPFTIPSGTQIMAGYRCNATSGNPAGCDAGPQIEGYGNMMRWNNVWQTLTAQLPTATFNWNIKVYVADAAGREYVLGELPQNMQSATGDLDAMQVSPSRNVSAYKIFRNEVFVAEVPGTQLTYTDTNVPGGVQNYTVTALFGTYESLASNVASVFVFPASYVEQGFDDGTPEIGFNVGSTKRMAVKFSYATPVMLKNAKVYVHTVGTAGIILYVYDDNGVDGIPGSQLSQLQYPSTSVVQGWNSLTLPADVPINDGSFYIVILETANASAIGMDTSSSGHSYKRITTEIGWEPVTEGEIMIHAIFDTGSAAEDEEIPVLTLDANNYPNPFNPETTIAFSVPTSGATSLKIYNLKGQLVRNLVNHEMAAGTQKAVWNGMDDNNQPVSSGLYFYRVDNNGKSITRKMLLAK